MGLINAGEIFFGTTKTPVKSYLGEVMRLYKPERVIHPCVGKFHALASCVKGGVAPSRNEASDLNLFSTVIGTLADPTGSIAALNLIPRAEVQWAFTDCDPTDELDYATRVLLSIKYLQLNPSNRFVEGQRRDLRVRQDRHRDVLRSRLEGLLADIGGISYRAVNLWDVLAELEAEPPKEKRATLYMSLNWYGGDYSSQMGPGERAFGWRGLDGREFDPEDLPELLGRADAIPGLTVITHLGGHLHDSVPDEFKPVMAHRGGRGYERLYANVDFEKYAPLSIPRLHPKSVQILGEDHQLTRESRAELVPLDSDTALYLRDLFVHRLGRASGDGHFFALTLDGKVAAITGLLLTQILGAGHPTTYINEVFGTCRTLDSWPRLNRLNPLILTSGSTRNLLLSLKPGLHGRVVDGIQTTEVRYHPNSKDKVFKQYRVDKRPDGMFKVIARGDFREDTWDDAYHTWWDKYVEPKKEGHNGGRRRRRRPQPAETA